MTYEEWMAAVDVIVERECGLSMDALPDWLSRNAYNDDLTPREGAEICLQEAGFPGFD